MAVYAALLREYGERHWWPAETPFEMMVGAILTQNVSWNNASAAISNLKKVGLLTPNGIVKTPPNALAPLLRPARFMNLKAKRLKNLAHWYASEFGGDVGRMSRVDMRELREKLLGVDGVGEETADCILLYACNKPVFVVDAYTRRVFGRLGLIEGSPSYGELQSFFMRNLPEDAGLFKDYHAQVVHLAKEVCRKEPICVNCPLSQTSGGIRCRYNRRHKGSH